MTQKIYDKVNGEWGFSGEARFRQYIKSCGYTANKHPHGVYGLDVEYVSPVEKFYADVERRTARTWNGKTWMHYPTLHVLARRPVLPGVLFFTLSADMNKAYVSFPEDLLQVKPQPMNNIHASNEDIRDHEIMRCLPLDLTKPIAGSIAQMNADRVRAVVKNSSYAIAMRVLRGCEPFGFGAPYGIDDDEWKDMLLDVEHRSGLRECLSGRILNKPQQTFLF